MKEHIIDATNKKIGRVATEAATILMGKDNPNYQPNVNPSVLVKISNVSKADISEKKKEQKIYTRYTGYPGGLRQRNMNKVIDKHGYAKIFESAVYGMLPSNRLRARMMKNLEITE